MIVTLRPSAALCRRLAVPRPDGGRGPQVAGGESLADEDLDHAAEAALGEADVVVLAARRAGLGHECEPLAADAPGEGPQALGLGAAHMGAVVVELHVMRRRGGGGHGLGLGPGPALLAVGEEALEVGVPRLRQAERLLGLVGARPGPVGLKTQGVQAAAKRGDLALVVGALHPGAARHEVVAQGDKGEGVPLRGYVPAVEEPVHLPLQPDGEAAA